MLVLVKSHINGYTKADGTVVGAHDDKRLHHVDGGLTLPSSAEVSSLEAAHGYWMAHFAGRTIPLSVHTKSRGAISVSVEFPAENDHAYTESADGGRVFDKTCAMLMDRIPQTIERPYAILEDGEKNLFLERVTGETHYLVVLALKDAKRWLYVFASAHDRPVAQIRRMRESLRAAIPKGESQKLVKGFWPSISDFRILEVSTSGAISVDPPGIRAGISHCTDGTMASIVQLVNPPDDGSLQKGGLFGDELAKVHVKSFIKKNDEVVAG